jgi:hypothetical protein
MVGSSEFKTPKVRVSPAAYEQGQAGRAMEVISVPQAHVQVHHTRMRRASIDDRLNKGVWTDSGNGWERETVTVSNSTGAPMNVFPAFPEPPENGLSEDTESFFWRNRRNRYVCVCLCVCVYVCVCVCGWNTGVIFLFDVSISHEYTYT